MIPATGPAWGRNLDGRVLLWRVVPAHPISGLPEIGTFGAHVGYSRHAMGTHGAPSRGPWNMDPRLRGDDTVILGA
jgi:hypothetical protein